MSLGAPVILLSFLLIFSFLVFHMRKVKMQPASIRSNWPGKFTRIICGSIGSVLLILVVWLTIKDYNNMYKSVENDFKISAPSMKVKKLEKGELQDNFRVLVQVFAVNPISSEILFFREKVTTPDDPELIIKEKFASLDYNCQITIETVRWIEYIEGRFKQKVISPAGSSSRSGGLYNNGSLSKGIKARPLSSHNLSHGSTFFSIKRHNDQEVKFYVLTSRLHSDDNLREISSAELLKHIHSDSDNRMSYSRHYSQSPFGQLISETNESLFIILLAIGLLTVATSKRAMLFPIITAAVIIMIISLKAYEYSIHEQVADNDKLNPGLRLKAAHSCSKSGFFKESGTALYDKIRE